MPRLAAVKGLKFSIAFFVILTHHDISVK